MSTWPNTSHSWYAWKVWQNQFWFVADASDPRPYLKALRKAAANTIGPRRVLVCGDCGRDDAWRTTAPLIWRCSCGNRVCEHINTLTDAIWNY